MGYFLSSGRRMSSEDMSLMNHVADGDHCLLPRMYVSLHEIATQPGRLWDPVGSSWWTYPGMVKGVM